MGVAVCQPRVPRAGRRAFTLIELLVVIAVIAILASLVMPIAIQAIAEAQRTQCKSNLSQLSDGLMLYGNTFGQFLPPFGYYMVGESNPYKDPWWSQTVLACLNTSLDSGQRVDTILRCPSWTGTPTGRFRGITCNFGQIFRYYTPARLSDTIFHGPGSIVMTDITVPSNTFLLMDGGHSFCYSAYVWARVDDWDGDGILDTRSGTGCIYGGGAPFRHNGTCNMLYVDGAVKVVRAREWLASTTEWNPYQ